MERESHKRLLEMKQTGSIKRVIETVGLDDDMVKGNFTPSEQRPLVKDADGELPSEMFSYSRIFGMLIYLSGHTRPAIAFAVGCCARYSFSTKRY